MRHLHALRKNGMLIVCVTVSTMCPILTRAAADLQVTSGKSPRAFADVIAEFVLENTQLRLGEPLKVRMTLRNVSSRSVTFRYDAAFAAQHVRIFDSRKREILFRMDAPASESPAIEIPLGPRKTAVIELQLKLWKYYELLPGSYYLRFYYDLRLFDDKALFAKYRKLYHSSDFVPWDTRYYPFSVRK